MRAHGAHRRHQEEPGIRLVRSKGGKVHPQHTRFEQAISLSPWTCCKQLHPHSWSIDANSYGWCHIQPSSVAGVQGVRTQ